MSRPDDDDDRHLREVFREVFHEIDPPPGGLTRLRARLIDDAERARSRRWVMAAVPALLVLVGALGWWLWRDAGVVTPAGSRQASLVVVVSSSPSATNPAHTTALARLAAHDATLTAPVTVGVGERGRWAVRRVAESDAVVFYLAGGLE